MCFRRKQIGAWANSPLSGKRLWESFRFIVESKIVLHFLLFMLDFMLMRYSTALRKRVLDFIAKGGSKAEAERTFGVSRRTIYNYLAAENPFAYQKPGSKGPRVLDDDELEKHVADFPDKTLVERAEHFGVSKGCISYAFAKRNITRKKRR